MEGTALDDSVRVFKGTETPRDQGPGAVYRGAFSFFPPCGYLAPLRIGL